MTSPPLSVLQVIDMFRGCRREDMPPHIFAMGQQAYRDMMITRQDQSLILMGLSGSGKTFNARYLLRYLTTIGQPDQGPVTSKWMYCCEYLINCWFSGDFPVEIVGRGINLTVGNPCNTIIANPWLMILWCHDWC